MFRQLIVSSSFFFYAEVILESTLALQRRFLFRHRFHKQGQANTRPLRLITIFIEGSGLPSLRSSYTIFFTGWCHLANTNYQPKAAAARSQKHEAGVGCPNCRIEPVANSTRFPTHMQFSSQNDTSALGKIIKCPIYFVHCTKPSLQRDITGSVLLRWYLAAVRT